VEPVQSSPKTNRQISSSNYDITSVFSAILVSLFYPTNGYVWDLFNHLLFLLQFSDELLLQVNLLVLKFPHGRLLLARNQQIMYVLIQQMPGQVTADD
jgi:hypothetical protein